MNTVRKFTSQFTVKKYPALYLHCLKMSPSVFTVEKMSITKLFSTVHC